MTSLRAAGALLLATLLSPGCGPGRALVAGPGTLPRRDLEPGCAADRWSREAQAIRQMEWPEQVVALAAIARDCGASEADLIQVIRNDEAKGN